MYKINCLNPIAPIGMDIFTDAYEKPMILRMLR